MPPTSIRFPRRARCCSRGGLDTGDHRQGREDQVEFNPAAVSDTGSSDTRPGCSSVRTFATTGRRGRDWRGPCGDGPLRVTPAARTGGASRRFATANARRRRRRPPSRASTHSYRFATSCPVPRRAPDHPGGEHRRCFRNRRLCTAGRALRCGGRGIRRPLHGGRYSGDFGYGDVIALAQGARGKIVRLPQRVRPPGPCGRVNCDVGAYDRLSEKRCHEERPRGPRRPSAALRSREDEKGPHAGEAARRGERPWTPSSIRSRACATRSARAERAGG